MFWDRYLAESLIEIEKRHLKIETDIIAGIAASLLGQTSENTCQGKLG